MVQYVLWYLEWYVVYVWYGMVWCKVCGMVWYVVHHMVWYGLVCGMVWMVCGMFNVMMCGMWYGMVCGMVLFVVLV